MESQCGKILVVMTRGQSVVGCVTFINEIRVKYLVDIIRITITILYYFFPWAFYLIIIIMAYIELVSLDNLGWWVVSVIMCLIVFIPLKTLCVLMVIHCIIQ